MKKIFIVIGCFMFLFIVFTHSANAGCYEGWTGGTVAVKLDDGNSGANVRIYSPSKGYSFWGGYSGVYNNYYVSIGLYALYVNYSKVYNFEVSYRQTSDLCVTPSYTVATVRYYRK